MKKLNFYILLFCLFTQLAQGQSNHQYFNIGGLLGANAGAMFQGYGAYGKKQVDPSFNFQVGYRLGGVVELGLTFGISKAALTVGKAHRSDQNIGPKSEILVIDASRTVAGARILFHYLKDEKSELYSGLRLGGTFIRRKTDSGHYKYTFASTTVLPPYTGEIKPKSDRESLQLVLIGFRHFPWRHVGFGVEIAAGAPYFAATQVCFRFPTKSAIH